MVQLPSAGIGPVATRCKDASSCLKILVLRFLPHTKNDIVGSLPFMLKDALCLFEHEGQGISLLPLIPMNYLLKWLASSCSRRGSLLIGQGIAE
jgi:hypothetical protein